MVNILSVVLKKISMVIGGNTQSIPLYLSALCFGISMLFHFATYLIFVGGFLLVIYVSKLSNLTKKRVCIDFFFHGLILCLFANSFLLEVASQNWLVAIPSWYSALVQVLLWITVSLLCSALSILLGLLLYSVKSSSWRIACLPIMLPILEIVRSYVFAIISYGKGGSLSPNFNWGSLAIPASDTHIIFASRIIGFYGLTLLVMLFSICIYHIYRHQFIIGLLGIFMCSLFIYTGWKQADQQSKQTMNVVAIHLHELDSMDYWREWDNLPNNIDLLVLPEYSGALDNPELTILGSKLSTNGVGVTSRAIGKSPNATNQLVYFDHNGTIINTQDKTFLIPSGEYMPILIQKISQLFNQNVLLDSFSQSQQLQRGSIPEYVFENGSIRYGALVCSGILSLTEYKRLTSDNADILINSASLSFIKSGSLYHTTGRRLARFHAVQNKKPFVQSSRSGESFFITKQGSIAQLQSKNETKILVTSIGY